MTDASIRSVGPSDAPELARLVRALAEYERLPGSVEATAETYRAQLESTAPPFDAVLAELDGRAVGFALFFPTYSTWTGRPGVWLEDLFVEEAWRARGIGRALLAHVAGVARARGAGRLEWSVLDWNELAIGFYVALGARVLSDWRICRMEPATIARVADLGPSA